MLRWIALACSTFALVANGAVAAPVPAPEGWTMEPGGKAEACAIDGPVSGEAKLSLATEAGLLWLLVADPLLPRDRTDGKFDVQIDGGDWIPMPALAVSNTAGISLGGAFAHAVVKASRISFRSGLGTWTFTIRNAGAAIDAVTSCAGEPTLAERDAMAPKPIPNAGGWMLVDRLPGAPGACSARLNGREVDTMVLSPAPDGTFVLMAGRADWATWGGDAEIGLAVDGAAPERLKASSLQNLIFVKIADPARARRLRDAKSLDWTLPKGHFHAEVKGLGTALDAVIACHARQSPAKG
jgi:hypothetical protein